MKKLKKISLALFIILLIISVGKVFAVEVHFKEYSEEFKEYLQLSDEEKSKQKNIIFYKFPQKIPLIY